MKISKIVIGVCFVALVVSGCATTNVAPSSPTNLTIEKNKPVLFMEGKFDGIKIAHRAVAVKKGKEEVDQVLDWANENVIEVKFIQEIFLEVVLLIEDQEVKQSYVQRDLNGVSSDWVPIEPEPAQQRISFLVKLPTEEKKDVTIFLKFRFVRDNKEDQLLQTKTLKYKLI